MTERPESRLQTVVREIDADNPSVLSVVLVAEAVIDGATLIASAPVEDVPPPGPGKGLLCALQLPR
jgi:hypothetical protein